MNKIKAVVIEDEIPAARLLGEMLRTLRPQWDIQLLPGSIEESVAWFAAHPHPDILFLDIQLTDGNSFLFIEQARPKSMIVFTTAYDQYAVQAFAVNSIDYLLKPIRAERLADTVERFEQRLGRDFDAMNRQSRLYDLLQTLAAPQKKYRTRFLIAGGEKLFTLPVDEVAYFHSLNKITFAVTRQHKEYIIDLSLDKLGEQLDPDSFFRANRRAILNIGAIQRVEPYFNGKAVVQVQPPFKEKIVVSKEKIGAFKLWLNY